MERLFLNSSQITDESSDKLLEGAKKILENAHLLYKIKVDTKEIDIALESQNRKECISILQKELRKNKKLIDATTNITGIVVLEFPEELLDNKTVAEIKQQLKLLKFVIAVKIITEHKLENILKKLMKSVIG